MSTNIPALKTVLEAALLAAGQPLSLEKLESLFGDPAPSREELLEALTELGQDCEGRALELREVASGFRLQVRSDLAPWVSRLWEEKPARYSRALLETLALIAYRQPISRAEIEGVRGVAVSTHIIKTLQDREWIRVVGHREVPGRPALYGTTRQFLDYFNLRGLEDLPPLSEVRDLEAVAESLDEMLESQAAQALAEAREEAEETGEAGDLSAALLATASAPNDRGQEPSLEEGSTVSVSREAEVEASAGEPVDVAEGSAVLQPTADREDVDAASEGAQAQVDDVEEEHALNAPRSASG